MNMTTERCHCAERHNHFPPGTYGVISTKDYNERIKFTGGLPFVTSINEMHCDKCRLPVQEDDPRWKGGIGESNNRI